MGDIFELNDDGQIKNRFINARRLADRTIDELLGMCKGMLADGTLNTDEINFLKGWLTANNEYLDNWPANILSVRICNIFADGIVDEKEKSDLFALLDGITGGTKTFYEDMQNNATTLPLCNPAPDITFQDKTFCLTGKFFYGTRNQCEKKILEKGGQTQSAPTQKTNYLVIGNLGSTDWMHSTFGRKIEAAVKFREKGVPLSIASEEHWVKFL